MYIVVTGSERRRLRGRNWPLGSKLAHLLPASPRLALLLRHRHAHKVFQHFRSRLFLGDEQDLYSAV